MSERGAGSTYPLRIEGQLDGNVSRWLLLVKWILLIPHFIALFFLGIAFILGTLVAFFAILFTGGHPREIFDFKVGVMRWGWRVTFYGSTRVPRMHQVVAARATPLPHRLRVRRRRAERHRGTR